MASTALVSGANGYIGEHVVKLLLEQGYKVIGAVRGAEKGDRLKQHFKNNFEYEVVGDFTSPTVFDNVLKSNPQVEYFFHVASPIGGANGDVEKNFIQPAVGGTVNALKAAKTYGTNLKSFVLTSSLVTVYDFDSPAKFTEESWNPTTLQKALTNDFSGYIYAKTTAEKAGWKFVEEEKPNFNFVSVNPSFVFGPVAFDEDAASPKSTLKSLINILNFGPGQKPAGISGSYIDVRDVAKAHLVAATNPEAANQRISLSSGGATPQYTVDILHKHFPNLESTLTKGDPSTTEAGVKAATNEDFSKTEKILGFKYFTYEQTVTDAFTQYFAAKSLL